MCELKFTLMRCDREECQRVEYFIETLHRCPPIKAQNCNGLKQMKSEREEIQGLSCSIHFADDDDKDDPGPNTQYTNDSTATIDRILKILPVNVKQPRLYIEKTYAEWCNRLQDYEAVEDLEVPDLTDCDTDSGESVVSDNEYTASKPFEIQVRTRPRRTWWSRYCEDRSSSTQ